MRRAGAPGRRIGPSDVTVRNCSGRRSQQGDNLALCGMPSKLRFLINGNAVLENFETTTRTRSQTDLRVGELARKLGRQTGGPWLVVSNRAIFDRKLHHLCVLVTAKYSESAGLPTDSWHVGACRLLSAESSNSADGECDSPTVSSLGAFTLAVASRLASAQSAARALPR